MLGYGAMELRGQPRGPAITDEAGRPGAQRRARRGDQPDRHLGRLRPQRGAHRPLPRPPEGRVLPGHQVRLPAGPARDTPPPYPHDYRPANVRAGVEQSLRRLGTDQLDLVQVHMSPSRDQLEQDGPSGPAVPPRRGQGPVHRHVGHRSRTCRTTSRWACSTCSRSRTRRCSASTRTLISEAAAAGAGTIIRGGVGPRHAGRRQDRRAGPDRRCRMARAEDRWERRRPRRPARRHEPRWSSCCGSRSAIPACTPRSSAPRTRSTSRQPGRGRAGPLPGDVYAEALRRLPAPAGR